MNINMIKARDLNEAWWLCIREVLQHGREYTIDRGSYEGQRRKEFDFMLVQIEKPGTRPLVPIVPSGLPAPTDMEYVEAYFARYLMSTVKEQGEQYTYGEDLEPQVWKIIQMYREDGHNTNQACMSIGSSSSIDLEHSQCLRLIDTRIQDGALHFFAYFRSWDLFGGFPANLAGLQLVKELMAEEIGVADGELVGFSKGLHLYDHHWELGKAVTRSE